MLWDESNLVTERLNSQQVTNTTLLQSAVHSILSKKAATELKKSIGSLNIETRARESG